MVLNNDKTYEIQSIYVGKSQVVYALLSTFNSSTQIVHLLICLHSKQNKYPHGNIQYEFIFNGYLHQSFILDFSSNQITEYSLLTAKNALIDLNPAKYYEKYFVLTGAVNRLKSTGPISINFSSNVTHLEYVSYEM